MHRLLLALLFIVPSIAMAAETAPPSWTGADYERSISEGLSAASWLQPAERAELEAEAKRLVAAHFPTVGADNAGPAKSGSFQRGFPALIAIDRLGVDPSPSAHHAEKVAYLGAQLRHGLRVHFAQRPRAADQVQGQRRQLAQVAERYAVYLSHRYPLLTATGKADPRALASESIAALDRALDDYFTPLAASLSAEALDAQAHGLLPQTRLQAPPPSQALAKRLEDPAISAQERTAVASNYAMLATNEATMECQQMMAALVKPDERALTGTLVGLDLEELKRLSDARNDALMALVRGAGARR